MSSSASAGPAVLDSSAVLAWLRREPGAELVDPLIENGVIGAPNWSEIWQKLEQHGADAARVTRRLRVLGLRVEPLGTTDAESAARMWQATRSSGLSLADRCCLAVAGRLDLPAVTADAAWARLDPADPEIAVRLIR